MQNQPPIQVIPMGVTAPYNPNKSFAISLADRREAREYQKKINKTLPLPRYVK